MIDEKALWEALKQRREENKTNMPAISLHVGMGINQAIGIMNSLPKIKCGTCKWHDDFSGACCNGDSPYRADFTAPEQFCDGWQENKESEDK